ncbi:MAG: GIY-YIG nuclease family protein [Richelia sp. RM1_1_1]|nr:GIY-YIG nuclease family protein [Richelia sp. RM1_1_1]
MKEEAMDTSNRIFEKLRNLSQYLDVLLDLDSKRNVHSNTIKLACSSFEKILKIVEPRNTLAVKLLEEIKSIENIPDAASLLSKAIAYLEQKIESEQSFLLEIISACKEYFYTSELPNELPSVTGLYIVVKTEHFEYKTLYVGMSKNIHERFKRHHRKPEFDLLKKTGSQISIYCLPIPGASDAILRLQENLLIKELNPLLNDTPVLS